MKLTFKLSWGMFKMICNVYSLSTWYHNLLTCPKYTRHLTSAVSPMFTGWTTRISAGNTAYFFKQRYTWSMPILLCGTPHSRPIAGFCTEKMCLNHVWQLWESQIVPSRFLNIVILADRHSTIFEPRVYHSVQNPAKDCWMCSPCFYRKKVKIF